MNENSKLSIQKQDEIREKIDSINKRINSITLELGVLRTSVNNLISELLKELNK